MDCENIVLSPKEIQNLLFYLEIVPSDRYICITRNIDTDKIYVSNCGEYGWDRSEEIEITSDAIS